MKSAIRITAMLIAALILFSCTAFAVEKTDFIVYREIDGESATYIKEVRTNKWYYNYSKPFDAENYYSDNDIQTVTYDGKTYTIDANSRTAYLGDAKDEFLTRFVEDAYEVADEAASLRDDYGFVSIEKLPYYKVVFGDELRVYIYLFDEEYCRWQAEVVDGEFRYEYDSYSQFYKYGDGFNYGDVNTDGKMTMEDVTLMQRSIASLGDSLFAPAGDITGDGNMDLQDVVAVQRQIAGLK